MRFDSREKFGEVDTQRDDLDVVLPAEQLLDPPRTSSGSSATTIRVTIGTDPTHA